MNRTKSWLKKRLFIFAGITAFLFLINPGPVKKVFAKTQNEAVSETAQAAWNEDFSSVENWNGMDVVVIREEDAVRITETGTASYGKAVSKPITVNLDDYPCAEINVSKVEPGGSWSLFALPFGGLNLQGDKPGVYSCNIKEVTGWNGEKTFNLAVYEVGESKSVYVKGIRLIRKPGSPGLPAIKDVSSGGSFWLDAKGRYSTGAAETRKEIIALSNPFFKVTQNVGATAGYMTDLTIQDKTGRILFSTSFLDSWGQEGDINKIGYYAVAAGGGQGKISDSVIAEYGGVFFWDWRTQQWMVWSKASPDALKLEKYPQGMPDFNDQRFQERFRWKYEFLCGPEDTTSVIMEMTDKDPLLNLRVETSGKAPYTYKIPFYVRPAPQYLSYLPAGGTYLNLMQDGTASQSLSLMPGANSKLSLFFNGRQKGDRVIFLNFQPNFKELNLDYRFNEGKGTLTFAAAETEKKVVNLTIGYTSPIDTSSWDQIENTDKDNPAESSVGWWNEPAAAYLNRIGLGMEIK
ncbi:MAG: hypothetical protein V2A65_11750 [Candidatus Omnitrophota bacterium]